MRVRRVPRRLELARLPAPIRLLLRRRMPSLRRRVDLGDAMSARCPTCDREECKRQLLEDERRSFHVLEWIKDTQRQIARFEAIQDCRANAVDWRARALRAEAEVERMRGAPSAIEALEYIVSWCTAMRGYSFCVESYLAAADDIRVHAQAAIERLRSGEPMRATTPLAALAPKEKP